MSVEDLLIRPRRAPGCATTCRCGAPKSVMRWRCDDCIAAYQRERRRTHPDRPKTGEARRRAIARSYANVYLRRGKIVRQPCFDCGSDAAKMRHAEYSKPLEVTWLCDDCVKDGWR